MSAAVASRNSPHTPGGSTAPGSIHTTSHAVATMDSKRIKQEDKGKSQTASRETRATSTAAKNTLSSPKQAASITIENVDKSKPPAKNSTVADAAENTTVTAPLAPPPRPVAANDHNNPDYFAPSHRSHLSSEPNPFEQSFGNPSVDTPGKSLLPSVASLTSPALGTGNASLTGGFGWGGSLRSGPLSPAMLSGPTGDYFDNIRSYPTPNESSLRTGLTPGGGGSMFPAPSPGTQALFNSFTSSGATPSGLEFPRAAAAAVTSAAAAKLEPPTSTAIPAMIATNAAMNVSNVSHPDNEAANGLFMLAQASAPQAAATYSNGAHHSRNNGSISATSNPARDDASDDNKAATRKSKRASAGKNTRRKTDDSPIKPPTKRSKTNSGAAIEKSPEMDDMDSDDMEMEMDLSKDTRKMTDEEKRKNFLERNRVAALKCRQRKKQWLQNLQNKVEMYSSENDALTAQVGSLKDEIHNLRNILTAHKDCPIAQQQTSSGGFIHAVDYSNSHYGNAPYGMAMQAQPAMGMSGPRRSS